MARLEKSDRWSWVSIIIMGGIFFALILNMRVWQIVLKALFPHEPEVIYPRASLFELFSQHILLVTVSSALAVLLGVGIGIFVTRPGGRDYLGIVSDISSLAQTIPPVAILALAVPFLGFGFKPALLALFLYSLLPIIRNTLAGIESVPQEIVEAAFGIGMTRLQILTKIELPLSFRVIMAGVRTSVVINVGTATVGAVVGAGGLGVPIISGLVRENPAFLIEGGITSAFLAIVLDRILAKTEENLFSNQ